MSITVIKLAQERIFFAEEPGVHVAHGTLAISGLSEGANIAPHQLPTPPKLVSYRPGANGLWGETQVPDSTNLYITVGAGGATAGRVDFKRFVA